MMSDSTQRQLVVLVDADNAQPSAMAGVLAEIAKFGIARVKRIYGDWSARNLGGWKEVVLKHSLQPVQQFSYTGSKNATDSAMIIDAMDLLHARRFQGFCLVSSDSDFTRLAVRIREDGLLVLGFGDRQKTAPPFVAACDKFIFVEPPHVAELKAPTVQACPATKSKLDSKVISILRAGVEAKADSHGWALFSAVADRLNKQTLPFKSRDCGYAKLSSLYKAAELFEIEERSDGGGQQHMYVRVQPAKLVILQNLHNAVPLSEGH